MSSKDMPMDEQMELNIDMARLKKKVAVYEMEAKARKKLRMPKKMKAEIKARVKILEAQFKKSS